MTWGKWCPLCLPGQNCQSDSGSCKQGILPVRASAAYEHICCNINVFYYNKWNTFETK
jgi:hypothetical protein